MRVCDGLTIMHVAYHIHHKVRVRNYQRAHSDPEVQADLKDREVSIHREIEALNPNPVTLDPRQY